MTEEQIKEMLNGVINNGEKWECRCKRLHCINRNSEYLQCQKCNIQDWQPYKLGEEIHEDWEYRKVETSWCVYEQFGYYKVEKQYLTDDWTEVFSGTKEECEAYIKEHTKKTWLSESMEVQGGRPFLPSCSDYEKKKICFKNGATEVCKKILEEAEKEPILWSVVDYLKLIIKVLGIEL